jgi:hypothetical protein
MYSKLCYLLFVPCVVAGGLAGFFGSMHVLEWLNVRPGTQSILTMLVCLPGIGSLSFLVLYGLVLSSVMCVAGKKSQVSFDRPEIIWGLFFSAALSIVFGICAVFLALLGITRYGFHDSM